MKRNILIIAAWYPVRYDPMIGLFVKRHAEVIAQKNKVSVIHVSSDANNKKSIEIEVTLENNVRTIVVYFKKVNNKTPIISHLRKALLSLAAYYKALRIYHSENPMPDVIHLHVLTLRTGIIAFIYKVLFSIPYLITEHSSYYLPEKKVSRGFIWESLTRFIAKRSNGISAVSEGLKNGMIKKGYINRHFYVIRNIVPDIFFRAEIVQTPTNEEIKFSNITCFDDSVKNISGIIRVIAQLKRIKNHFTLYLVGDGPDRDKIEKLVRELKLTDCVKLTGLKEGTDLVNIYIDSAFTVLFSHYETMAVVIAESFACGRPVIATRTGGIPELVNETNGILVEPANEEDLLNKLLYMIDNYQKYDKFQIREGAYQQFSSEIIAKRFEEFYEKCLSNSK